MTTRLCLRAAPRFLLTFAAAMMVFCGASRGLGAVRAERAPDRGLQPQAIVDAGVVHLVYFTGDAKAGDIFYTRRSTAGSGSNAWARAIRVNSQPGSAIAVGTIRGAHLAVGRRGRVHVAWNGSGQAQPKAPEGSPMLYARLDDAGSAFEPQRNLMTQTRHLDGGGSVAADADGNVYVVFHASPFEPGVKAEESGRAVYIARSINDGRTFPPEVRAADQPLGVCACCGLRATVPAAGQLFISYRAVREKIHRDMTLLASRDGGSSFKRIALGEWQGATCPMSSTTFAAATNRLYTAWETGSQVHLGGLDLSSDLTIPSVSPPGAGKRKHPTVAVNAAGGTILVWTEGTGWARGGGLAWQEFDGNRRPVGTGGRASDVPVWGLATAYAAGDGNFVVVY